MQPGGYACSTPEIDEMVDMALPVPGVAGTQIAGAGLGGCIMVLARHESVAPLRKALATALLSSPRAGPRRDPLRRCRRRRTGGILTRRRHP